MPHHPRFRAWSKTQLQIPQVPLCAANTSPPEASAAAFPAQPTAATSPSLPSLWTNDAVGKSPGPSANPRGPPAPSCSFAPSHVGGPGRLGAKNCGEKCQTSRSGANGDKEPSPVGTLAPCVELYGKAGKLGLHMFAPELSAQLQSSQPTRILCILTLLLAC